MSDATSAKAPTTNQDLLNWVNDVAQLTQPDRVHWCDGSAAEYQALVQLMLDNGDLHELNQDSYPGCYLHRSNPDDVARVEHLTFVCSEDEAAAGPNNNWKAPTEAHAEMDALFTDCMQGRTLYVIPYCMGPIDSPLARCGVEITDSPYVVANMNIMTRMGAAALARIEKEGQQGVQFVKGLHSTGTLDPEKRRIMHFPEERMIKSINSGYGGNALLGKKCHALRIASWQAKDEGWLAEHMLILGLTSPEGKKHYIAAAFPSACGKTNLAMLIPPESMPGWKVETIGDDIAWLHLREDGQLWAINPEAGYFGVVPGTNRKTNQSAYDSIMRDTIFTNVGVTENNEPWWEGKNKTETPTIDWQGQPYDPDVRPAAHPNSRFTVSASNNPLYSPDAEAAAGVPISAIIFGGRRKSVAPLVYQAKNWEHGVLVGAGVASETTAAATGAVGVVRRDSMAMKPFCGYNFADYFNHWLGFAQKSDKLPKIFHVNWFRQNDDGDFLWPGFSENMRVLKWITERCDNQVEARETEIGHLPQQTDLDIDALDLEQSALDVLLNIDKSAWRTELEGIGEYLDGFGEQLPEGLKTQHTKIAQALQA